MDYHNSRINHRVDINMIYHMNTNPLDRSRAYTTGPAETINYFFFKASWDQAHIASKLFL